MIRKYGAQEHQTDIYAIELVKAYKDILFKLTYKNDTTT